MGRTDPYVRNITDTALWAAIYRARETNRARPLFHDPYALRLAGERGAMIADGMPGAKQGAWAWSVRTMLFDQFLMEQIEQGIDLVINLAAGLDARPYRMFLPNKLRWVEIDLPEIIDHKESILAEDKPRCHLERYRLDLADVAARRDLLEQIARQNTLACVITEGLLIYLDEAQAGELSQDLAALPCVTRWILDLVSPGLLKMLQKAFGKSLAQAGAPLRFAPQLGPDFFLPFGWGAVAVRSMLKSAAQVRRLPWYLQLMSYFPEAKHPGNRPWSGVCLMEKR